jgi:hypothetical protein
LNRPVTTSAIAFPASAPRNQVARPSRRQERYDGLASVQDRLSQLALAAREVRIGAARRFAAHCRRLAEAEQDDIG